MRRLLLVTALAATFVVPAAAQTESPSESPSDYELGVVSLEAGDLETAAAHFRSAFASEPTADHALALAATLQERGSLRDAIELYRRLLAEEFGPLDDAMAQGVVDARAMARARQATVRLQTRDDSLLTVFVDGEPVGSLSASTALELSLDPGTHRLVAAEGDRRGPELTHELAPGSEIDVVLSVPAAPTPEQTAERQVQQDAEAESAPIAETVATYSSPRRRRRIWITVGVLVAVGAATAIALALRSGDDSFERGPFRSVEALHSP